jgi:hypothetical protein
MDEIATKKSWNNSPITNPKKIDILLSFSEDQYERIKHGLIPQVMEDKWFIFFENKWLYFHRSWTGCGIYKTEIISENKKYNIKEFFVERNKEIYANENDDEDIDNFVFLIAWGLLKIDVREIFLKNDTENETLKSWSSFGSLMIAEKDILSLDTVNNMQLEVKKCLNGVELHITAHALGGEAPFLYLIMRNLSKSIFYDRSTDWVYISQSVHIYEAQEVMTRQEFLKRVSSLLKDNWVFVNGHNKKTISLTVPWPDYEDSRKRFYL